MPLKVGIVAPRPLDPSMAPPTPLHEIGEAFDQLHGRIAALEGTAAADHQTLIDRLESRAIGLEDALRAIDARITTLEQGAALTAPKEDVQ